MSTEKAAMGDSVNKNIGGLPDRASGGTPTPIATCFAFSLQGVATTAIPCGMATTTTQNENGAPAGVPPLSAADARTICERFALKHKLIFDDEGEVGFGRECVGFRDGGQYINHNPCTSGGDYEPIAALACPAANAPDYVNSYHKHDCMAVLGRGDEAVIGLAKWVLKLEAAGEVKIVEYETGAVGVQALFSGVTARAVTVLPNTAD